MKIVSVRQRVRARVESVKGQVCFPSALLLSCSGCVAVRTHL